MIMIGLDTNVLVRYIVQDDSEQSEAATRLIESMCTADTPGGCEPGCAMRTGLRFGSGL